LRRFRPSRHYSHEVSEPHGNRLSATSRTAGLTTPAVFLQRNPKHNLPGMSHAGMRAYEQRTREIVSRFIAHRLTFPACISALDAELADLVPRMADMELPALRVMMLANLARVNYELEQRGTPREN